MKNKIRSIIISALIASIAIPALAVPVGNDVEYIPATRNLGVGVINPAAKLEVNGQLMITGGSPAAGQVLTTDARGLATWEPATVSGSNIVGTVTNVTNAVNATNMSGGTINNSTFTNGVINGATLVNVTLPTVTNVLISKLIAPDGSPDPAVSVDNTGRVTMVDSLRINSSGAVNGVIDFQAPYYGYSVDVTGVTGGWSRSFNFFDNGKQLAGFGGYGYGPDDSLRYIFLNAKSASHTGDLAITIPPSNNVGMGINTPSEKLEVAGNVKATKFIGDGSMLTGITSGNVDNATTANIADFATAAGTATMAISSTVAVTATNVTGGTITNVNIYDTNLTGQITGGTFNGTSLVNITIDDPNDPWILIHSEDFEVAPTGWSNNTRTSCAGHNILGGFNVLGTGASLTKSFDLSAYQHSHVMVRFNYYALDSWDDEAAVLNIDGSTIWTKNRINGAEAGRDVFPNCGTGGLAGATDVIVQGNATIEHTANSIQLSFTSTLNQAASDESFGIDNVEIWVKKSGPTISNPPVNPPAPPAYTNWVQADKEDCTSACAARGKTSTADPYGFKCTAGEARSQSSVEAFNNGLIKFTYGCWSDGNCQGYSSNTSSFSYGKYCYKPGQKKDNDRTDITVACYCT